MAMAWLAGLLSDYDKTFVSLAFVKKERKTASTASPSPLASQCLAAFEDMRISLSSHYPHCINLPHNTTLPAIALLDKVGDIETSKIVYS